MSANVVIRLIQINYCLMYLSAGLSKLKGNSWWNGTAPWYCMTNPEFSPLHLPVFRNVLVWLCQTDPWWHRWLWEGYMSVMDVFTLTLEIGFPFLVWTRLRPVMVCGAILLHLGIALNMGLIVFSLFMFTLLLCWMTPAAIRTVFARPPSRLPKLELRFSGADPRQRRAAAVVAAADVWQQVQFEPVNGGSSDHSPLTTRHSPIQVESGGQVVTGREAVRRLACDLGMTQPVAWLLRLPGLSHLAAAALGGTGDPHALTPADHRQRAKPVSSLPK